MLRTKQQLRNTIADIEEWLKVNSKEHKARPMMEQKLNKAKNELAEHDKT